MKSGKQALLILKPSPARENLTQLLTQQGFEVEAQPSTFRAVSGLARRPREVVVIGLDDLLDEEIEVVRVIREECPSAFLVLTFTAINRRKAQAALEMGADCYVLEPLRPEEVVAAVRHVAPAAKDAKQPPAAGPLRPEEVEFSASSLTEEEPHPEPKAEGEPKAAPKHEPPAAGKSHPGEKPEPAANARDAQAGEPPRSEMPAAATATAEGELAPDRLASLRKLGASVAHEINNPLTTLSGWIQLLLKKANGNQDLRRTLVNMKEEADRIADVVRELSAISEPDLAGRGPMDVNSFAEAVIDCFVNANGNQKIRVKKVFVAQPPTVKVDKELLVRAVCDLLNSGYLSLGNSGSLVFTTTAGPDYVEVHVYEPGSQVNLEPLRKGLGSVDLGDSERIGQDLMLARCQEIIGSHGGTFSAECDPREGLNFQLRLPKAAEERPRPGR